MITFILIVSRAIHASQHMQSIDVSNRWMPALRAWQHICSTEKWCHKHNLVWHSQGSSHNVKPMHHEKHLFYRIIDYISACDNSYVSRVWVICSLVPRRINGLYVYIFYTSGYETRWYGCNHTCVTEIKGETICFQPKFLAYAWVLTACYIERYSYNHRTKYSAF